MTRLRVFQLLKSPKWGVGYQPTCRLEADSPLIVRDLFSWNCLSNQKVAQLWVNIGHLLEIKGDGGARERAAAHFLHGWGLFLLNPADPAILEDAARAAELAPDEPLFTESAAFLAE